MSEPQHRRPVDRVPGMELDCEAGFARIAALARDLFDAPLARVSLVDEHREGGVDGAFRAQALTLGPHAVVVVEDASADPRFRDDPSVAGPPHVRFYAAALLTDAAGRHLGALFVIDTAPRPQPPESDLRRLRALAELVVVEIERARAQKLLLEKQRLLDMAETMSGVGHWRWNVQSDRVFWSDEVFRVHGLDRAGFDPNLGGATDFYHPDDRETVTTLIERAVRERRGYEFQLRIRRADGEERQVASRAVPEVDATGRVVAVFGVLQDVTDSGRALQEAMDSQARYKLLADNAADVISRVDLDGCVHYVSPSAQAMYGYSQTEIQDAPPHGLVVPEDVAATDAVLHELRAGTPEATLQSRVRHRDGHILWVETRFRLVRGVDGAPQEIVTVARDITQTKSLETELRVAREEAEAGARAEAEFLANMSHELRTPLNSIVGFSGLIANAHELLPETRRRAELVSGASRSLVAIVNDILEFSKFDADGVSLNLEPVDVDGLLTAAVDLVREDAQKKGVRLSTRVRRPPQALMLDPVRVRQVVLNLLGNAVKFTDAGGQVVVTLLETEAGRVRIEVSDTGIGIPEPRLEGIFDRFAQADTTTSRRYGGTGLGLAICRRVVDAMGGEIGVSSVVGEGSTFWFTLDANKPASVFVERRRSPEASGLEGCRLLLADDNDVNRDLFRAMLAHTGMCISEAHDGAQAIEAVRDQTFDIVLMDVQMPVVDGLDATRAIRGMGHADLPIVALTANVLPAQIELCRRAGMNGHLAKPYTAEAVIEAVGRWATRRHDAASEPAPSIHEKTLDDLRNTIGAAALDGFLTRFGEQLTALHALFAAETCNAGELGRHVHRVRGLAAMLGFVEVTRRYADLERADDGDLAARLAHARSATQAGLADLERRRAA